jgi:hypothetical protein
VKLTAEQKEKLKLLNKYAQEAFAEKKAGRPREAILQYEKAVLVAREVYGANAIEVTPFLDEMADLHHGLGQWESARDMRK